MADQELRRGSATVEVWDDHVDIEHAAEPTPPTADALNGPANTTSDNLLALPTGTGNTYEVQKESIPQLTLEGDDLATVSLSGFSQPTAYASPSAEYSTTKAKFAPEFIPSHKDSANPEVLAAASLLSGELSISLPGRRGLPSFKFLINPTTINISRQSNDGDALTRGGPITGLTPHETIDVTIQGQSAGFYFLNLVDGFREHTLSYRNLVELETIFDNNGNFFEGESADPVLTMGMTGGQWQQIKYHGDVVVRYQNFLWSGAFTEFSLENDAEKPYFTKFSLSFSVFSESLSGTSPWGNSIAPQFGCMGYRGHAYEVMDYYRPGGILDKAVARIGSESETLREAALVVLDAAIAASAPAVPGSVAVTPPLADAANYFNTVANPTIPALSIGVTK